MYVCGMTVYDYCHLGHARFMVVFDVIARYLRAKGYEVTYVRNITDIDDKIINRANENGEHFGELTGRFIEAMHQDTAALGVLPPDEEPRATAHIPEILAMVERLLEKGHAYLADNGDVYYAVNSFDGYGRLSGKSIADLRAGARVDVGEKKRDTRKRISRLLQLVRKSGARPILLAGNRLARQRSHQHRLSGGIVVVFAGSRPALDVRGRRPGYPRGRAPGRGRRRAGRHGNRDRPARLAGAPSGAAAAFRGLDRRPP
jgi:hypothetical protein